jgi:hypothetical protein
MKPCQYCFEDVQELAVKCKHCGSSLVTQESKVVTHNTHVYTASSTLNPLAVTSLVLAIGGIVFAVVFWPFISQVASIICGHVARSQITASEGKQTGEGMALAGLIISYLLLIAFIISAIGFAVGIEMLLNQ